MHSCIFTYAGLYKLFKRKLPDAEIVHTASVFEMAFHESLHDADLIVSELYGLNEDIKAGTKLLAFVQSIRGGKPLLVMTDVPGCQALGYLRMIPSASFMALSEDIRQVVNQVDQVLAGNVMISPSLFSERRADLANADVEAFSPAEIKVYNLLQQGLSVTQIAEKISRSIKTVSAHKRNMMGKLGVNSEVELYACFNQQ